MTELDEFDDPGPTPDDEDRTEAPPIAPRATEARPQSRRLSVNAKSMLAAGVSFAAIERRLADPASSFGRWHIPGLVPASGVVVIYGPSGSYKTFIAIYGALRIAAQIGPVVYFAAEDFEGAQVRSLAAAKAADCMAAPLRVFPFEGVIHDTNFAKEAAEVVEGFSGEVGAKVVAVFFDTLGAGFGGASQDDAGPMSVAMGNLHRVAASINGPVIVTHHPGKDARRGMRGSQVIRDRADAVIEICRGKGTGTAEAKTVKFRNGPNGSIARAHLEPFKMKCGEREHGTLVVRSLEPVETQPPKRAANDEPKAKNGTGRVSRDARSGLDILRRVAAGRDCIDVEEWREAVYAAADFSGRKKDAQRRAFLSMRESLTSVGLISVDAEANTVSVRKREDA